MLGPVIREFRIIQLQLMSAERQLYLHRSLSRMIEFLIIIDADRIRELQRFQLTHAVPAVKSDTPVLQLGRTDHPVKKIRRAATLHQNINASSLGLGSGLTCIICHLGKPEATMQNIDFLSVQTQLGNE